MSNAYDDDFYDNEWPEGAVVCDKCNGDGTIDWVVSQFEFALMNQRDSRERFFSADPSGRAA